MTETKAPPSVPAVTTLAFPETVIASPLPVVVDFHAAWCGPCALLAPVLEELAEEFAGRLAFVKVDVDAEPALAKSFGIRSLPSLIFYQGGHPRELIAGMKGKADLRRWIEGHLAS